MTRSELRSCIKWEIDRLKLLKWEFKPSVWLKLPATQEERTEEIQQRWSNILYYRAQMHATYKKDES